MVNIPLLQPLAIQSVVQELPTPENLVLANTLPRESSPIPYAVWDIVRGSRGVGKPNVPNSEAHVVDRLGRSQKQASLIYYREKKTFGPTTLLWMRRIGEIGALASAQDSILREVADLNTRLENFIETVAWQAFGGTVTLDYPDVQGSYNFEFKATHTPTALSGANAWNNASKTGPQIVQDIKTWKRVVQRDARVPVTDAWTTGVVMDYIFQTFAQTTSGFPGALLSDNMKDQYYQSGVLPGFMGMNWHIVEGQYEDSTGAVQQFVPDNKVYFANLTGDAASIIEGPSADLDNGAGTGKFAKTWKAEDPSAQQYLLEYNFAVVVKRPDQFLVATVA